MVCGGCRGGQASILVEFLHGYAENMYNRLSTSRCVWFCVIAHGNGTLRYMPRATKNEGIDDEKGRDSWKFVRTRKYFIKWIASVHKLFNATLSWTQAYLSNPKMMTYTISISRRSWFFWDVLCKTATAASNGRHGMGVICFSSRVLAQPPNDIPRICLLLPSCNQICSGYSRNVDTQILRHQLRSFQLKCHWGVVLCCKKLQSRLNTTIRVCCCQ